jgi:hypothetical protein
MVSIVPGDCDGAAEAGATPAVSPTMPAIIAAPLITEPIILRVFMFRSPLVSPCGLVIL